MTGPATQSGGAPARTPAPLIGRDHELARLAELVDQARAGHGGAVLVRGEPGVGKTALVEQVRAAASDFRVLHCRGVEAEVELPFSGLQTLLLPLLPGADQLPDGQREALSAALAMEAAEPASIVTASMAALTLIAGAAASEPTLLLVDDLHWMDESSLLALAFIARRLGHDRVLLLMAAREQAATADVIAEQITLDPLPTDAAAQLAERLLDRSLLPETAAAVSAATGGNPLAVVEAVRLLGDNLEQLSTGLNEPLPPTQLIERGFASRLSGFTAQARDALLLVSTALADSAELILDALEHLHIDAAVLDEAEDAGVIARQPHSVAFTHPLLRSLVFHGAAPAARRRCHAALADVSRDPGAQAWHAAAASQRPDESIAAALADAAHLFQKRGGQLAAARALEQAARLTPDAYARAERLQRAGISARAGGRPDWAMELLDDAYREASANRALQLQIESERIPLQASSGSNEGVLERQLQLADDAAGVSRDIAIDALAQAAVEAMFVGAPDVAMASLERMRPLGQPEDPVIQIHIRTAEAAILVHYGIDEARAIELSGEVARRAPDMVLLATTGAAETLLMLERDDAAERVIARALRNARALGDLQVLIGALFCEGYRRFRAGDWAAADLALEQACQLCESRRIDWHLASAAALLALVRGSRGDDGVHALVTLVDALSARNAYHFDQYIQSALGVHALAHRDAARAVLHLENAARHCKAAQLVDPSALPWPGDLVEAHLLAGDTVQAEEALGWLRARLQVNDRKLGRAVVGRLEGIMAREDFDTPFQTALKLHAAQPSPFEQARTHLQYGRRLRRAGRRSEAAEQLTSAARIFERLSAGPWLQQVHTEQQASGSGHAAKTDASAALLSPQETAVADLVAEGLTNRQIAAQLFLTPKTIEWHLRQIYRKLGIKSRVQLASYVQAQSGAPTREGAA